MVLKARLLSRFLHSTLTFHSRLLHERHSWILQDGVSLSGKSPASDLAWTLPKGLHDSCLYLAKCLVKILQDVFGRGTT